MKAIMKLTKEEYGTLQGKAWEIGNSLAVFNYSKEKLERIKEKLNDIEDIINE